MFYFNGVLHWLYVFSALFFSLFFSLIFLNKSYINLILVSETILIILFLFGLLAGSYYNIYFSLIFSFIILVLGGLELALNLLLIFI